MQWYGRFVLFHKERCGKAVHSAEMRTAEVEAFLTHLAVNREVAASSQNQAMNALVFFYREVLNLPLESSEACRAKHNRRLPVVLQPVLPRDLRYHLHIHHLNPSP